MENKELFNLKEQIETPDQSMTEKINDFLEEYELAPDFIEKYSLNVPTDEDFLNLAKKSYDYRQEVGLSGLAKNKNEVEDNFPEIIDKNKEEEAIKELSDWYYEYLVQENKYDLPFSQREMDRLSQEEQEELKELYNDRNQLLIEVANLNRDIKESADIIQKNLGTYSTQAEEVKKKLTGYKNEAKKLYSLIKDKEKNISALEKKALSEVEEFFTEEDRQKQRECLNYYENPEENDIPKGLTKEEIYHLAKEAIFLEDDVVLGEFKASKYKGKDQLSYSFWSNKNGKHQKFTFHAPAQDLKPGRYACRISRAEMFTTPDKSGNKNKSFSFAPVEIVINLDEYPKSASQKKQSIS
jgi:hypothetical protein